MKKITIEDLWADVEFEPNESQRKAILHADGPLFLTAGPDRERLSGERPLQRVEQGMALFSRSREIAPHTAEDTSPVGRAEAA